MWGERGPRKLGFVGYCRRRRSGLGGYDRDSLEARIVGITERRLLPCMMSTRLRCKVKGDSDTCRI